MVTANDGRTNFFVKKEDIDNNSRAEATQRGLIEMNNKALIMIYKGELSNNFNILDDYQMVILTEIITLEMAESLNQYCRNKRIAFVYAAEFGLSSFLFTDYGDDFITENLNGKENKKYFIKSISNSCPGIVEISPIEITKNNKKIIKTLKLGTGDFVDFKNVKGMTELNDTPPRPIMVISNSKFTIEDTSNFQEFAGSGIVEEVKIPYPKIYKPLSEAKNFIYYEDIIEDDLNDNLNCEIISDKNNFNKKNDDFPWSTFFSTFNQDETLKNKLNEIMHLAVLSLHEFFNIHQFLPHFNEQKEIQECLEISEIIFCEAKEKKKKWVNNMEKIDKIILEKTFKFSRFYFIPMTCFFGGFVSQEILKYIGLYKPSNQWTYFNFFDLIDDDNLKQNYENLILDDEQKINIESYLFLGNQKIKTMKNIKILIIGLNDVGCEILRIFLMLNFPIDKNNITILENNKNKIDEKINEIKNCDKYSNIKIINDKIDIKDILSEKEWWQNSNIVIDTLSYNYNFKEKLFIIKNSEKDNKILFDINAQKTIGSYDLILPKQFKNNNNYKNKCNLLSKNKEIDTPKGLN